MSMRVNNEGPVSIQTTQPRENPDPLRRRILNITTEVMQVTLETVFPPATPQKFVATKVMPVVGIILVVMVVLFGVGYASLKLISRGEFPDELDAPQIFVCTAIGVPVTGGFVAFSNCLYEAYENWKKEELKKLAAPKS